MRRFPRHPFSPAMVVGLVALFFALGGVGYAKKVVHLIDGSTIKKGTIQVDRLTRKARAALKGNRGLPGTQGPQGPKGETGPLTGPAGGDLSGSYPNPGLAPAEGWHEVGAAGEPGFQNGWIDSASSPSLPSPETVAFYKDRQGVVHLKGQTVGGPSVQAIFFLPAGYRPAPGKVLQVAVPCGCEVADSNTDTVPVPTGRLSVFGTGFSVDGAVVLQTALLSGGGTKFVNLDGVTFRAAS